MKWNELRKIAESHGWEIARHGSEHDLYGHPDKKFKIAIARHGAKEVPTGTFSKLKKQIGF